MIRIIPEGGRWPFMTELSMPTIARAKWSKRQLFKVMCEFWSNHLHITCPSDKVWFARWPGLADDNLVDGDLAGTTDYGNVLAELLEMRCGTGSLSTVFPGLTSDRIAAFKQRA